MQIAVSSGGPFDPEALRDKALSCESKKVWPFDRKRSQRLSEINFRIVRRGPAKALVEIQMVTATLVTSFKKKMFIVSKVEGWSSYLVLKKGLGRNVTYPGKALTKRLESLKVSIINP